MTKLHPLQALAEKFPQLYLPVEQNGKDSILYQNIVKRGYPYVSDRLLFTLDQKDFLEELSSPYGSVGVLYLNNRNDFERFIRIMVHRLEPVSIPASMGASMISGIIDWSKINAHRMEYEAAGHPDWNEEFKRFTQTKENYQTTLLVVGRGGYSALDYRDTPYSLPEWENISLRIRIYHEYTHFICRNRYGVSGNPIWDEIVADGMGLLQAIGHYDVLLAKKFLGIEKEDYRAGGRLENYLKAGAKMEDILLQAREEVDLISCHLEGKKPEETDFHTILEELYPLQ